MIDCSITFIGCKYVSGSARCLERYRCFRRKGLQQHAFCSLNCRGKELSMDGSYIVRRCERAVGFLSLAIFLFSAPAVSAEVAAPINLELTKREQTRASVSSPSTWELLPSLEGKDYGKPRMRYSDFATLPSGVQYRDVRVGDSLNTPRTGDRVVISWSGYTIGYYGRIFEAKNRVQGGAFGDDREYSRYVLGRGELIPALEEALLTMHPGGIRQVIVPPEHGYPLDGTDWSHDRVGPKPRTFSGMRALNFVLENKGLVDKTLLFNVELIRIDRPGEHGFETFARR
ncbi:peptidylprolyl cistrans isomerase [Cyanidiococcus yangmingshanensis]|uniref:peptidylprolyl isomerase n=1 Tax=Cyanidiococcus yangmingshanensis TaxID=2690220 RepID=A0A7J7IDC6_9RHOD|nr:peptidylprolyl cistrans isomerase [Cyanidiococcus yangmingshanensis]